MPALDSGRDNDSPKTLNPSTAVATLTRPHIPLSTLRKPSIEPEKLLQWNTASLGLRLGADLTSAASASALIAPVICVIDRYVRDSRNTYNAFWPRIYSVWCPEQEKSFHLKYRRRLS